LTTNGKIQNNLPKTSIPKTVLSSSLRKASSATEKAVAEI
jgi:hypothetical protein